MNKKNFIFQIFKKDLVEDLLSFKFQLWGLIIACILFSSIYIQVRQYRDRIINYQNHLSTLSYGEIIIPPEPLSIFAFGMDGNISRFYYILGYLIFVSSKEGDHDLINFLLLRPDLLFVVKVFMSLFAILLSFNSICNEKECGTLRLLSSYSVGRFTIVLSKFFEKTIVILVPFDFFLFFSTIILHISGFFSLGYEEMLRIFFFVLIANLYILFFLALGFFLSTLFYFSAQSMSFALLLWAFVVFIIPNLIPITTNALFPIPSTDKFEEEKMRVFLKIKFEKNKEHPGSLGIDGLLEWESDIRKIEENFENKLNNFIDFTIKLERMFPVGSLTEGITKCMRTSIMDERRFISWVKRFRDKNALNSLLTGETEQFIYKRTNLSETLRFGILNDLLPLFVYIVFILIGIIISFNRYDVR